MVIKPIIAVLSVFTSFTFFGAEQAGKMLEATAHEKYERTKDQAIARSELILAARVSEAPTAEAEDVKEFLNAVYAGVKVDDPEALDFQVADTTQRRKRLSEVVEDRVSELTEAMNKVGPIVLASKVIPVDLIASFLRRQLTDNERRDAKEHFEKTVDEFVDKQAELSSKPISRIFEAVGLPMLAQSIIEELYKDEVIRLSKHLSDPLSELLFRPTATLSENSLAKISVAANRPIFDLASLPAEVVKPAYSDRVKVRGQGRQSRKILNELESSRPAGW